MKLYKCSCGKVMTRFTGWTCRHHLKRRRFQVGRLLNPRGLPPAEILRQMRKVLRDEPGS